MLEKFKAWRVKYGPRKADRLGGLVVLLICLNGGIALTVALLWQHIYEKSYIYLLAAALNAALIVWWFKNVRKQKMPLRDHEIKVLQRNEQKSKKERRKKHKKH